MLNLLSDLRQRLGLSYLFVSHDLAVVRHVSDRIAVMYLGQLMELGPKARLLEAPRHPYTQALRAAASGFDAKTAEDRKVILEDESVTGRPERGCVFAPRCPLVETRCREERPELRDLDAGQRVACHFA